MFRFICCQTYCLALKHLIVLGKYFLYVNALNTIIFHFDDFFFTCARKKKISLDMYIAMTSAKFLLEARKINIQKLPLYTDQQQINWTSRIVLQCMQCK